MYLKNVSIVGDDHAVPRDIEVRGSHITAVHRSDTTATGRPTICFGSGTTIAFPGLINSHDHIDFNLFPCLGNGPYPDYLAWSRDIHVKHAELIADILRVPTELRTASGVIKNIVAGVTTVLSHELVRPNTDHSLINLPRNYQYLHALRSERWWRFSINNNNNSPILLHLSEGTNEASYCEADSLIRWNLRRRELIAIHGVTLDPRQASHLHALVWCPLSNLFLYGATANVAKLKRQTSILFGTDSTLTSPWNIWDHIHAAYDLDVLSPQELFAALTLNPTRALGLKNLGQVTPGSVADIVIAMRKDNDPLEAFFQLEPQEILLIMKAGRTLIFDATIADQIPDASRYKPFRVGKTAKYWVRELDDYWRQIEQSSPDNGFVKAISSV